MPVGAFGGRAEIMDQLSPLGPVYQAGTLSGNPLAMAAGLAQLRELERIDGWQLLEDLGAQLRGGDADDVGELQAACGLPSHWLDVLPLFYRGPVTDLASAKRSDRGQVRPLLHHCLDAGVYFAPSQFETGFISTAHPAAADRARRPASSREALLEQFALGRCRAKTLRPAALCTRKGSL